MTLAELNASHRIESSITINDIIFFIFDKSNIESMYKKWIDPSLGFELPLTVTSQFDAQVTTSPVLLLYPSASIGSNDFATDKSLL